MAKIKTSDKLVSDIKRRAMIPQSDKTFTSDDFLDILNEEFSIGLLPKIMELHEEYYVVPEVLSVISGSNPPRYSIPYRAIGNKLRDVQIKHNNNSYTELTRLSPENKDIHSDSRVNGFYIENDEIVVLASVQGELEVTYFFKPNDLVAVTRGALITGINHTIDVDGLSVTELEVSSLPTHFTSNLQYDIVRGRSPNKIISYDMSSITINSNVKTITFLTSDLSTTLVVGDYIMEAEETIFPQLPVELLPVLTQMAAIACLDALGDEAASNKANMKLVKMERNLTVLIDNRVEGAPKKVVNKNSRLGSNRTRR